jgi:N-acetylmuramoyl-L-alanine amidase
VVYVDGLRQYAKGSAVMSVIQLARQIMNLPTREKIARTAWGEADILGLTGMQATINTGQNRIASGETWWGDDLDSVFIHPWQYSCWNSDNKRLPAILSVDETDPNFADALGLADQALAGNLIDITDNSTHYFNHLIVNPPPASFQGTPLFVLEPHWYYRAA